MSEEYTELYKILKELEISYEEIEHKPVFTVAEAQYLKNKIEGIGCKNLFLTDKKDFYLVILEDSKKADFKKIASIIEKSHLSFASIKKLQTILKLSQGSVTPFGIINDKENKVTLLIDKDLKDKKVLFHPNVNTKTLSINFKDLIKFIEHENHKYILF